MNVVMIIPTGIGCEVGGHAGDATPAAKLLAATCDNLVVHPNVVNASDIMEGTENMWYVEGSVLDRFLEGQVALEEVYSNRMLLVANSPLKNETVNSVNAARYTIGADITLMELTTPLTLKGLFGPDGKATGIMTGEREAFEQISIEMKTNPFDVLAIQTVVDVGKAPAEHYLRHGGVNPWGGAEAVCSRYFSRELGIQCAHAPVESGVLKTFSEIVDPRLAAEVVSISYLHCVLKGLHRAPKVVDYNSLSKAVLRVDDIDMLISPDGCWGRPHEACANWDIPIMFVKENRNIYNGFDVVPRNCFMVDNYMEAAGIVAGRKAGVSEMSVRRVQSK
ncbi:hypothetical protein LCGC14_0790970 [marine sediment metagenome]|uniref:DUF3326 domain-containing protein n=1 Tax=marine sediment metagenome TaxID=412755 RepID=A0A0F9PSP0_9ZZZZ